MSLSDALISRISSSSFAESSEISSSIESSESSLCSIDSARFRELSEKILSFIEYASESAANDVGMTIKQRKIIKQTRSL